MFLDSPCFVWILPSSGRDIPYKDHEEYLEHHGKWIIEGDKYRIIELADKLDPYVESRKIDAVKYTKKDPETDPFPNVFTYAMCVYSDDRKRDKTAEYLKELNVEDFYWKYDRETAADWKQGGKLQRRSKK